MSANVLTDVWPPKVANSSANGVIAHPAMNGTGKSGCYSSVEEKNVLCDLGHNIIGMVPNGWQAKKFPSQDRISVHLVPHWTLLHIDDDA